MATALEMIFGEPPIVFGIPQSVLGWGGVVFVAGDLEAVRRQIASNPRLAHQIELWRRDRPVDLSGTTRITTDDWPYIYLEKAAIPNLYFLLGGLLLLLLLVGVHRRRSTIWPAGGMRIIGTSSSWALPSCYSRCRTSARHRLCSAIRGRLMR